MDDRPASPPPAPTPAPAAPTAPTPGERRLERPPSDRYREPEPPTRDREATPAPDESRARGVAIATVVAVVGGVAITLAGGIATMTAGLLVIAALVGWAVAVAIRAGGGFSPSQRTAIAIALALFGVGLGQVGLWLLGREEGGVLTLVDYLADVFGFLVPVQLGVAAVAAWLAAR